MNITILGAGNMGCLLGVLLTEIGEDVQLVDINETLVNAIRKDGFTLTSTDGKSRHVKLNITTDIADAEVADLIIVAVKGYATASAMQGAKAITGNDTYVLSVQNGAGNIEAIAEYMGDTSRIIGGVVEYVVFPIDLNKALWITGTGGLKIGPVNGAQNLMVEYIRDVFRQAGIHVEITDNVRDLIWNEVLQNSCLPLTAILGLTNDEYMAYPSTRKLVENITGECIAVCRAMGVKLSNPSDPVKPVLKIFKSFCRSGEKPKSSMLQDIAHRRRTEIDTITGSIVREGKQRGVPTPVNETIMSLVKAMEEQAFNIH